MTKLLTKNYKVTNALAFRSSLDRVDPDPDNLYLWFGRDSEWPDEQNPPTPEETVDEEFDTRETIIGMKKITVSNTALVIPRYNWTTGTIYDEYDSTDDELFTKQFYVINSNYQVYKCLDNDAGSESVIQPSGTSTAPIQTGDGYTWKFMYDLSGSMIETFLINDWMPVPVGGQKTAFQIVVEENAVWADGSPANGHGANAAEELAAHYLMIAQSFDGTDGDVFPVDDDFRQFGLWKNPRLVSDESLANGPIYSVNDSNSDIDITTGSILYVENRRIITRDVNQAENIQLILQF